MANPEVYTHQAIEHIRYLSEVIGGRGSCTSQERRASEYAAAQLHSLGLQDIRVESFQAVPSTYWPYALALATALTGSLTVVLFGGFGTLVLGAVLNTLGAWAMAAETEFLPSWGRWFLPRLQSQNVSTTISPQQPVRQRVVLCAHVDTHRTPVFYSSERWYLVFSVLVALAFLSMVAGGSILALGIFWEWAWVRWAAGLLGIVQASAMLLCLHADFTPYSPGANDNASGVALLLTLAQRLVNQPLTHTEVHLAFTGCEEVGDWGINAFLNVHAASLGAEALYVILDEVGLGQLKYLSADGLLLKHRTHPEALRLARQVTTECPSFKVVEGVGVAYTDALLATRRGLVALTLCTVPSPESHTASHWHQMSDTLEFIQSADLANTQEFTWKLLQLVDRQAGAELAS